MTSITLKIDDDKAVRLRLKAQYLGMDLEQFIAASFEDLAELSDPDFLLSVKNVIAKNSELYNRLA